MSQITFNYPAMLAHAGEMNTYSGVLTALGADLAAQQASLQAAWHGDTSMSQAAWQAQWNTAMEELIRAYRAMGTTHETNTLGTPPWKNSSAPTAPWAPPTKPTPCP
nr:WXG100 family type VII secretion target [Mycobacteroides franklinii]